jgi:phosphoglycerate kinase
LIKKFLSQADFVLLGGVIANMLLATFGLQTGRPTYDPLLLKFLRSCPPTNHKMKIPVDVVVARDAGGRGFARRAVGDVRPNEFIFDIGPDTVALYGSILRKARTVVWSGPLGLTEEPKFAYGTRSLGAILAKSRAESIVGGGDTLAALHKAKLLRDMSYASTAGGAMLEFLERGTLPGLEPLRIR